MTADDVTLTEVEREALYNALPSAQRVREAVQRILADRLAAVQAERDEWKATTRRTREWANGELAKADARAESTERRLAEVEALVEEWEREGAALRARADSADSEEVRYSLLREAGALHGAAITLRHALGTPPASPALIERQVSALERGMPHSLVAGLAEANPPAEPYVCRHGKVAGEHWCDDLDDHARADARPPALAQHDAEVGARALTDPERAVLAERLHRDGFYAPAVRARILDAFDDTLRARADALTTEGDQP